MYMSRTTNFKTNITASATSTKSLSLKEVIAGVLESDHEDGLSSFEEPKEEIGDFEGNSDIKEFFFSIQYTHFFSRPC